MPNSESSISYGFKNEPNKGREIKNIETPKLSKLAEDFLYYGDIVSSLKLLEEYINSLEDGQELKKVFKEVKKLIEEYSTVIHKMHIAADLAEPKEFEVPVPIQQTPLQKLFNLFNNIETTRLVKIISEGVEIYNPKMYYRSLSKFLETDKKILELNGVSELNQEVKKKTKSRSFVIKLDLNKIKHLNNISPKYGDVIMGIEAGAIKRVYDKTLNSVLKAYGNDVEEKFRGCSSKIVIESGLFRVGGDEFAVIGNMPTELQIGSNKINLAQEFAELFEMNLQKEFLTLKSKHGQLYYKETPKSPILEKDYDIKSSTLYWVPEDPLDLLIFVNYLETTGQIPDDVTLSTIKDQMKSVSTDKVLTSDLILKYFESQTHNQVRKGYRDKENDPEQFLQAHPQYESFFGKISDIQNKMETIGDQLNIRLKILQNSESNPNSAEDIQKTKEAIEAAKNVFKPNGINLFTPTLDLLYEIHFDKLTGQDVELYDEIKEMQIKGELYKIAFAELKTKPLNDVRFAVGDEGIKQALHFCLKQMFNSEAVPSKFRPYFKIARDGSRNIFVITKKLSQLPIDDPIRIELEEAFQKLNSIKTFEINYDGQSFELPLGVGTFEYSPDRIQDGISQAKDISESNWRIGAISILADFISDSLGQTWYLSLPEIIKKLKGESLESQIWWNQMTNGRAKEFAMAILSELDKDPEQLTENFLTRKAAENQFDDTLTNSTKSVIIPLIMRLQLARI